jgi:hypothetical protein
LFIGDRGEVRVDGTIAANVVNFTGILEPGCPAGQIGQLLIEGNFRQHAGQMIFGIRGHEPGVSVDTLIAEGTVELGGHLNIDVQSPFAPFTPHAEFGGYGDKFEIISGSAIVGQFANVSGLEWVPFAESGKKFVLSYDPTSVTLTAFQAPYGDANGDGSVDLADFEILRANFGGAGGWDRGDFTGDHFVGTADFALLKSRFGTSIEPTVVPEPASETLIFFGIGGILLLAFNSGKHRNFSQRFRMRSTSTY